MAPSFSFFLYFPSSLSFRGAGHLPQISRDAGARDVGDAGMGVFSAAVG